MRLENGWREWSASARSCARKTADLRTTFRDGRYGPLQPTAVAEADSLNDGLGGKRGNPTDLSSDDSAGRLPTSRVPSLSSALRFRRLPALRVRLRKIQSVSHF